MNRLLRGALAAALITLGCATTAPAAPGDLDTSWGYSGQLTWSQGSRHDIATDVVHVTGDSLVAGYLETSNGSGGFKQVPVLREMSYGGVPQGGAILTLPRSARMQALARQGQNDVIAVGFMADADGTGSDLLITRVSQPGADVDTTFGPPPPAGVPSGVVVDDLGANRIVSLDVAVDSSGRIVVAGSTQPSIGSPKPFVRRYTSEGALDSANFATSGQYSPAEDGQFGAVALQPDGKILAAGRQLRAGGASDIRIDRLTAAGAPDESWDDDTDAGTPGGSVVFPTFGASDLSGASAILVDGANVVVTGYGGSNGLAWVLARRLPTGMPDPSYFGSSGMSQDTPEGGGRAADIVKIDDRYYVAGGLGLDFALARYSPTSGLDTSFGGGDGYVTTDWEGKPSAANAMDHLQTTSAGGQPLSRLVLAGSVGDVTTELDTALARYFTDGTTARTLTVTRTGTGTVTGTGISCGTDCTETYGNPGTVTLTAGGGTLVTWQGCDSYTGNECAVNMAAADRTVTAVFTTPQATTGGTDTGGQTTEPQPQPQPIVPPQPPAPQPPSAAEIKAGLDQSVKDAKPTNGGGVTYYYNLAWSGTLKATAVYRVGALRAVTAAALRVFNVTRSVQPGPLKLTLKPTAKAKKVLKRKRKLKVKLTVTFTPTGGAPVTSTRTLTLRYRK